MGNMHLNDEKHENYVTKIKMLSIKLKVEMLSNRIKVTQPAGVEQTRIKLYGAEKEYVQCKKNGQCFAGGGDAPQV